MAYKLLELQNMGIYWDTTADVYSNMSLGELAVSLLIPLLLFSNLDVCDD